jgi:hypothetical protein
LAAWLGPDWIRTPLTGSGTVLFGIFARVLAFHDVSDRGCGLIEKMCI